MPQNTNGKRNEWHEKAREFFSDRELVFMDPDNGLINKQKGHKEKFCFPNEVADFYHKGKDVVYYCSKGRRSNKDWNDYKNKMKKFIKEKSNQEKLDLPTPEILVLTYHKGTQRSYVFVLHPEAKEKYAGFPKEFLEQWKDVFTEEPTEKS